jgi:hypothetical protein
MADSINRIADALVTRSLYYLGSDFAQAHAALAEVVPGIMAEIEDMLASAKQDESPEEKEAFNRRQNIRGMIEAVTDIMNSKRPSQSALEALIHFYNLLQLPVNLRLYATAISKSTNLFGRPEDCIAEVPQFYERTFLTVLKQRLARYGHDAKTIQQALQGETGVNPAYAIWLLSGAVPPLERANGKTVVSEPALHLAEALLGQHPDFTGQSNKEARAMLAANALFGLAAIPSLHHIFGNHDAANAQTAPHWVFANALPLPDEWNDFPKKVLEACMDFYSKEGGIGPAWKSWPSRPLGDLKTADTYYWDSRRAGGQRERRAMIYGQPDGLKRYKALMEAEIARLEQLAWDKVPEFLRTKFAAAGFDNSEQILEALNHTPGQTVLRRYPGMVVLGQTGSGYTIQEADIQTALMAPDEARLANGLFINPLHDALRRLADPEADIDAFYGLEKPEWNTREQIIMSNFVEQIREAAGKHPLLQHAASLQQFEAILNLIPGDLVKLLINPVDAYIKNDGPSGPLGRIISELDVRFTFEECKEIRSERMNTAQQARKQQEAALAEERKRKIADRSSKRAEILPISKPGIVIVDPWEQIPKASIEICATRGFADFNALVERVREEIDRLQDGASVKKLPSALPRQMKLALQNLTIGFLPPPNSRPVIPMHALLMNALGVKADVLANKNAATAGRRWHVQANFVEVLQSAPALAHILSWPQLGDDKGIRVVQLSENLAGAWTIKDRRTFTVVPSPALAKAAEVLGADNKQMVDAERLVPLDVWLESYRAKTGSSCIIPASMNASSLVVG